MLKIVFLCLFLFNFCFAFKTGYVYISTGTTLYDGLSSLEKTNFLTYNKKNGLPNINSIIEIDKDNILLTNIETVNNLFFEFEKLKGECEYYDSSFSDYMDVLNKKVNCYKNTILNEEKIEIKKKTKIKILGYTSSINGIFAFVKIIN